MPVFSLLVIQLGALAVPGPDFFLVSQTGARTGFYRATLAALGVSMGVFIWVSLAVAGLSFITQITWVHVILTLFGTSYLLWLGSQLLKSSFTPENNDENPQAQQSIRDRGFFLKGLLTNLSNPKVIIYFSSVFASFIQPSSSLVWKATLAGAITLESIAWFVLVAGLFSHVHIKQLYLRYRARIECLTGIIFILFALSILWFLFD